NHPRWAVLREVLNDVRPRARTRRVENAGLQIRDLLEILQPRADVTAAETYGRIRPFSTRFPDRRESFPSSMCCAACDVHKLNVACGPQQAGGQRPAAAVKIPHGVHISVQPV